MATQNIVSHDDWIAARLVHLQREKELTQMYDRVMEERRQLPWEKVEKSYTFESTSGTRSLADLFAGRSQLIVYHFMYGPGWKEGCPGCSFLADHIDGARQHFEHHDVKICVVSRAPLAEFLPFKKRMGWTFDWVSSYGSDFNYDFHVSFTPEQLAAGPVMYNFEMGPGNDELPGTSVFAKDEAGTVFHTYSSYARGGDALIGAHHFLDLTPKGRNEGTTMDWMRHHDKYDDVTGTDCGCGSGTCE